MKKILNLIIYTLLIAIPLTSLGQNTLENLKGRELSLRETANVNRKVYVAVGDKTAYYIHDQSRLFPVRKAEKVTITSVNRKTEYIDVSYSHPKLGKGKIRIYDASTPEMFDAVIHSAFGEAGESNSKAKYIANKNSGFVHFAGCNHLPEEEDRVEISEVDIQSGKYTKCSLCFYNVPRVSGFDLEMRLGNFVAGQVQMQNALVTDDKIQARVRAAGQRVLSKWIMPLKGYNYKFFAVDSDVTNAFAAPGGKIYITNSLLDSLESEEELEAVLAHEVAHVELRHGYRQFRSAEKAAAWGAFAAALLGGVNNQAAFDLVNLISQLASSIVLSGHSRRYESEADAMAFMYFEANKLGKGKSSFRNVLRKLQYNQDFYQPEKQGNSFLASHPEIAARIDAIEKSEMKVFSGDDVFYGYNNEGELVATVSFQAQRVYQGNANPDDSGLQVIALVETTSALGVNERIKDIKILSNAGVLLLDNKENTEILPNDAVGASFVSKTQRNLVETINNIELKMKNVAKWEKGFLNGTSLIAVFTGLSPSLAKCPRRTRINKNGLCRFLIKN
jgi:Zn-dependent protease with chaperone function